MAYTITVNKRTYDASLKVKVAKDPSVKSQWIAKTEGKTKVHTVKYFKNQNRFICDCEAFGFGKGKQCKHIMKVLKQFVKNAEWRITP